MTEISTLKEGLVSQKVSTLNSFKSKEELVLFVKEWLEASSEEWQSIIHINPRSPSGAFAARIVTEHWLPFTIEQNYLHPLQATSDTHLVEAGLYRPGDLVGVGEKLE